MNTQTTIRRTAFEQLIADLSAKRAASDVVAMKCEEVSDYQGYWYQRGLDEAYRVATELLTAAYEEVAK